MKIQRSHAEWVSTSYCVHLWAVPKNNFASGLPEDIEDAMVPEEQLFDMETVGIDPQFYYVIDKDIPQSRLGNGVVMLRLRGGGWITKCPSSEALNHMDTSAGALPQAAPPLEHSKPLGVPPRKRFQSGVLGDPDSKKRRLLYETLIDLASDITTAANHDNWCHASDWDHDNVVDHMDELMQLLCVMREDHRKDFDSYRECLRLVDSVASFLSDLLLSRPSFDHLRKFNNTFEQLVRWGAESTAEIQLLMSLATHPMDQPKPFDMSSTDVLCRIQFRKTRMFLSFYEKAFKIWLDAAPKGDW